MTQFWPSNGSLYILTYDLRSEGGDGYSNPPPKDIPQGQFFWGRGTSLNQVVSFLSEKTLNFSSFPCLELLSENTLSFQVFPVWKDFEFLKFSLSGIPCLKDFKLSGFPCLEFPISKDFEFVKISLFEKTLNFYIFPRLESLYENALNIFIFSYLKSLWNSFNIFMCF